VAVAGVEETFVTHTPMVQVVQVVVEMVQIIIVQHHQEQPTLAEVVVVLH
jgi:hypothetical protein